MKRNAEFINDRRTSKGVRYFYAKMRELVNRVILANHLSNNERA